MPPPSGHLFVGFGSGWKRRWVAVKNEKINFYEYEDDTKEMKSIDLKSIKEISEDRDNEFKNKKEKDMDKKWIFHLHIIDQPDQSTKLMTPNQATMFYWISEINRSLMDSRFPNISSDSTKSLSKAQLLDAKKASSTDIRKSGPIELKKSSNDIRKSSSGVIDIRRSSATSVIVPESVSSVVANSYFKEPILEEPITLEPIKDTNLSTTPATVETMPDVEDPRASFNNQILKDLITKLHKENKQLRGVLEEKCITYTLDKSEIEPQLETPSESLDMNKVELIFRNDRYRSELQDLKKQLLMEHEVRIEMEKKVTVLQMAYRELLSNGVTPDGGTKDPSSNQDLKHSAPMLTVPDTSSRRQWVADTENCMDCKQEFSLFRRRHHCRVCGTVKCSSCCPRPRDTVRICIRCDKDSPFLSPYKKNVRDSAL